MTPPSRTPSPSRSTTASTYPSLYDPAGKLILDGFPRGSLNPQAIPSTIVLDRDGKIAARSLQALDETKLRKMIDPADRGEVIPCRLLAAKPGSNGTVHNGALLLALPIALLGGLVSFFSPCVLPLVPGYLSYVTGVSGTDLAEARRGRMVSGAALFVLGFTVVFVSGGALFGFFGATLQEYRGPSPRSSAC